MSFTGDAPSGYQLVEEESFLSAVEALGGSQRVDTALAPVIGGLLLRPQGFPVVPGWANIRMAKTKRVSVGGKAIPPLRVWFQIGTGKEPEGEDDGCVYLLSVKENTDDVGEDCSDFDL